MKKFLLLLVLLLAVGCGKKEVDFDSMSISEKANYKLNEMSLDEKIAQMMILYYTGSNYGSLQSTIKEVKPGGFILMGENITTYDNTLNFVKSMQNDSTIPMFISIDQEGGLVQRLNNLTDVTVTDIPAMYDLGLKNDSDLAYQTGKVMAEELRTIGVNITFAPVLDIYSNPNNTVIGKRSFSSDPDTVSTLAESLAKGLEDNDVKTCYKHFQGHGDTATDSHVDVPLINKSIDELNSLEFIPFVDSIKNGAEMIMVGHIALPNITGDNTPASLSKEIITDILKNKLNYNGLVITDALNMGALRNNYTDEEIVVNAVMAGVDILLMPNGSRNTISYIKKAINENKISVDTINNSVLKILEYKYKYFSDYKYLDKSYLGSEEHLEIINKIKAD